MREISPEGVLECSHLCAGGVTLVFSAGERENQGIFCLIALFFSTKQALGHRGFKRDQCSVLEACVVVLAGAVAKTRTKQSAVHGYTTKLF